MPFAAATSSQLPGARKNLEEPRSISVVFVTVETKDKQDGAGEEESEGEEQEGE